MELAGLNNGQCYSKTAYLNVLEPTINTVVLLALCLPAYICANGQCCATIFNFGCGEVGWARLSRVVPRGWGGAPEVG